MKFLTILVAALLLPITGNAELRLNDIQMVASHNSYKEYIDADLLALIAAKDARNGIALDYHHIPLHQQMRLGLRGVELDVLHDPEGGVYSHPLGLEMLASEGLTARPYDASAMADPGLKVLHIQDIDFRSSCATFVICLQQLRDWSDANRGHAPVIVTMNAKADFIDQPGFVVPLPFDADAFDAWDEEIRKVLSPRRLITPDDVRGKFATLREAVLADRWPSLKRSRGKFLFVLDEGPSKYGPYLEAHPSLRSRVMFVNAPADRDEAAFLIINDPIAQGEAIRARVREGFMVRTRADANTLEARRDDTRRREAAFASGAQVVSTDYYLVDPRFGGSYSVELPPGGVRCNPIRLPAGCRLPF